MSWGFEAIDVYKAFGERTVLRGLNFGARMAEVTAIVGAPASGKTVTFRLLAGLDRPDDGAVLVGRREISSARGRALQKLQQRMGMVFQGGDEQDFALFRTASVLENVTYPMRRAGRVPKRRMESVAREELERFGLAEWAREPADALPAGLRKPLAMARAMALRAPLMLVDAFEAGLEPNVLTAACDLVREDCRRRGGTWLLTLRDEAVAERVADQIVVLGSGAAHDDDRPLG